jgi:uncharacterized protein (TIGR01777 family)
MHVVLAGASGLIGSALATSLRADGHRVTQLVRRPATEPDLATWDPSRGELASDLLAGTDAVVCLSGANVGDKRWTDAYKQTILRSRVDTVGTIARTLAAMDGTGRPPVFLAGSAVGYYGDAGQREVGEEAPPGDTFLSEVCVQWEAAADPARQAGVRVTHLRTGIVLEREADLLKRLVPITKAGLAGPIGSGRQYLPWISLHDEVAGIRFLLDHDLPGPVNLTAPAPATNRDFTKTLARVLHRPAVLPVPGFAVRVVAGELATETLIGQRAIPRRLLDAGFTFTDTDLEATLRGQLDR